MQRYHQLAQAALKDSLNKEKVFAVLERKGKPVCTAVNSYTRSHKRQRDYADRAGFPKKVYLHAEIAALIKSRCRGDTMYVYRLNRKGELLPSRPCPVCQLALNELKIRQVYYEG